ncbi:MAG: hypothetical protein HZA92_00260 [Verrucomicrobia bacterium]|nr:hypothetical protein [Verrucomicrobiota bacterium]
MRLADQRIEAVGGDEARGIRRAPRRTHEQQEKDEARPECHDGSVFGS